MVHRHRLLLGMSVVLLVGIEGCITPRLSCGPNQTPCGAQCIEGTRCKLGITASEGDPSGDRRALKVTAVLPRSPAAIAGLVVGDVILFINGEPASLLELSRAQDEANDRGRPVRMEVRRQRQALTMELSPRGAVSSSFGGSGYGKRCVKGQPCGGSCISWSKKCRH